MPSVYRSNKRKICHALMRNNQSTNQSTAQSCSFTVSLTTVSMTTPFPLCSGYHVQLTRGRSPIRARPETLVFISIFKFCCFCSDYMSRFSYKMYFMASSVLKRL